MDTDIITNELEGSAFFPKKPQQFASSLPASSVLTIKATARPGDEPAERRPDRPTGKRVLIRRGFEYGQDQLTTLKKISLQQQLEGGDGSMSAMVREALDDYFKKRNL
ncbi:hypothetical protein [Streptomyces nymphaeiformis]|uniref:Uncharacterized protein n=1 Tax=Streptomyces nymphaeiformis TaxID=2663842 RepID=A0A7W7U6Y0_9ACTN|nr:hypothetical protein [Streptomyces nymphaeiformis]MBB4984765.1 hypothetical protein [Streptomyces nymphaeiformis]